MFRIFRPIPAASLRLLIFDLDGTLIDSGADLCASVNATLHHFGRPPLPQTVISTFIGDGAARLISRSLGEPVDAAFLDSAIAYFLDYYREHKLDNTFVYPGVFPSLDSLRFEPAGAARSMAVLTNKPVIPPSRAICEALRPHSILLQNSRRQQFPHKEARPHRPACADSGSGGHGARDADDWGFRRGYPDRTQCGSLEHRLHLWPIPTYACCGSTGLPGGFAGRVASCAGRGLDLYFSFQVKSVKRRSFSRAVKESGPYGL